MLPSFQLDAPIGWFSLDKVVLDEKDEKAQGGAATAAAGSGARAPARGPTMNEEGRAPLKDGGEDQFAWATSKA